LSIELRKLLRGYALMVIPYHRRNIGFGVYAFLERGLMFTFLEEGREESGFLGMVKIDIYVIGVKMYYININVYVLSV
jgi:hypothetical protein